MPERPNLLFIFTDQQRRDTMACYGNDWIETPNLNALAERSYIFENAYVTQPICTPSRSSIMTGLYPHTSGLTANNIPLKPETKAFVEMLPEGAYHTGYFGKWHLGDEITKQHGFDEWRSFEDNYRRYYSKPEYLELYSDYHHFLVANGFQPDAEKVGKKVFDRNTAASLPEQFTKARFLGAEAADFIQRNSENPFALFVNFLEPHSPYHGPLDCLYDPFDMPVGPHFLEMPPSGASLRHRRTAAMFKGREHLKTEDDWRALRAKYMGNVTLVDRAVGDIMKALKESGVADNTIVVFTSEHGDMMGDHHILAKSVFYEEAISVPLLVSLPGQKDDSRRIGGRFSQVDLAPTLLELMGCDAPSDIDGVSRASVFSDSVALRDNDVFIEWHGGIDKPGPKVELKGATEEDIQRAVNASWRTIVSREGWKLNASSDDRCELYDLKNDPYERNNLIDDAGWQPCIKELMERIRKWQTETGDDMELPIDCVGPVA